MTPLSQLISHNVYYVKNEEDIAPLQAQFDAMGINVQVRLARELPSDIQAALAEAERLYGGRRKHFKPQPGGERPYDPKPAQGQIELDTAA